MCLRSLWSLPLWSFWVWWQSRLGLRAESQTTSDPLQTQTGYGLNTAPVTTYRGPIGNDSAAYDDASVGVIDCSKARKATLRVEVYFDTPGATCQIVCQRFRKNPAGWYQATFNTTIPVAAGSGTHGSLTVNVSSPVFDLSGEPYMTLRVQALSGGHVYLATSQQ